MYVFLKQEKPEMDDFEREKTLVLKEKFQYFMFYRIPLQNMHEILLHILLFRTF